MCLQCCFTDTGTNLHLDATGSQLLPLTAAALSKCNPATLLIANVFESELQRCRNLKTVLWVGLARC